MSQYIADESFSVDPDGSLSDSEIISQISEDYDILCECEEELVGFSEKAADVVPSGGDGVICDMPNIMSKISEFIVKIVELSNKISSIRITASMTKFPSFAIVMKKAQILKLKTMKLRTKIEQKQYELQRKAILRGESGDINATSPENLATAEMIQTNATASQTMLSATDIILKMISGIAAISVDGECMGFYMTPKATTSTKIDTNGAVYSVPQEIMDKVTELVDKAASGAQKTAKEAELKSKEESGSAMAASTDLEFSLESTTIPKIDLDSITNIMTDAIKLLTAGTPEALPKYEKLKLTNPRFMLFLTSNFETAMKNTFGLPGV